MTSKSIYLNNVYIKIEKIGEGTFGEVYKAIHKTSGEVFAIKKIKSGNLDIGIPYTTLREIGIFVEVKHPNIVNMNTLFVENERLYLVFEYLPYDFSKYINLQVRHFGLRKIKIFFYQMLQATLYCHSKRILHRDIKPANILIDPTKEVIKLADFGSARLYCTPNIKLTKRVVTLTYRAPELLFDMTYYGPGVDIWSLGCILPEMILLKPLFPGPSEIEQLFAIFHILGTPTKVDWPDLGISKIYKDVFPKWNSKLPNCLRQVLKDNGMDLLLQMLQYNPAKRISALDALKHSFFDGVTEQDVPAYGREFKIRTFI